jgi:hypothetical protein
VTQITNPVQFDRLDPYLIDVYDLKERFDKPKTFDAEKGEHRHDLAHTIYLHNHSAVDYN